jgi:glycosyltransferase involved in cell wall biosynthesis
MSYEKFAGADVYVYICFNVFSIHKKSEKAKDICYVTHLHKHSFDNHIKDGGITKAKLLEADGWINMCSKYYDYLSKEGFPKERMSIIPWGINTNLFDSKIRIGIFQNGEVEGKGTFFLKEFCEKFEPLDYFEFRFIGKGWDSVISILEKRKVAYRNFSFPQYNLNYIDDFPALIKVVDYILIPSLWEGGPMGYLDALATGKPVIASDVGFIKDVGGYYALFEPGNISQLASIFEKIVNPVKTRLDCVKKCDWSVIAPKFITEVERIAAL